MPRHRTHHSTATSFFPHEFPQHLVRFWEASGHSWAALTRQLGTPPHTVRRWRNAGVRPSTKHTKALLARADERSLSHPPARRTWLHQDPAPGPLAECAGRLRRSFRMRGRAGRHHGSGESRSTGYPRGASGPTRWAPAGIAREKGMLTMHSPRNGSRRCGRRLTALAARWSILAALLLVAFAALLALPAQAQTATTLVSNTAETADRRQRVHFAAGTEPSKRAPTPPVTR